jgi:hypothetical protein
MRETLLLFALFLAARALPAAEMITWKPVETALLKIDDQPVKVWNIFQAHKKSHLVLVELGQRYLMLDIKNQEVFELDPRTLQARGDGLRGPAPDKSAHPLPSDTWTERDVGRAEMIRFHLTKENRIIEVQLPHPLDLRMLY